MENTASDAVYRFEGFELDLVKGALISPEGAELQLRAKSFELLRLFVVNAGRLLNRDTIHMAIWPNVVVTDDAVTQCVRDIRRALGDQAQAKIRTVRRRGYVFAAGVTTATEKRSSAPPAAETVPLPDRPSIAVLPFLNLSPDPEQEYFADGMVEEIITALSRIRWLFVIARNSTFTYKGRDPDVRQVGRELGVRYVLEGSVRKAGQKVRINGQLIDALTGAHLWADHFDGALDDLFELQDRVATSVAGVIEPELQVAEMRRSAAKPTTDLDAYDLYLRGLASFFPVRKEGLFRALALLEQAIAIDPRYGLALSWAAVCHLRIARNSWTEEPEQYRRKGIELARRALEVGEHDPVVLAQSAEVLAGFGEDIDAMIGLVNRALHLNPSYARGWFLSCMLRHWAGQPDVAMKHLMTSHRLSPLERSVTFMLAMGSICFFKHQFDEAVPILLSSIQDHPEHPSSYRFLAACYAHLGRLDEAHAVIRQLRGITSRVVPNVLPWRRPEDRELFLSGLRLASGGI